MKKTVVIKENDLRKIVTSVLNEISYNALYSTSDKLNSGWYDEDGKYRNIDDVFSSIDIIRQFLNRMEESFTPIHGQKALNYFYDNKKAPNEGMARKCQDCLSFIEAFVQRKQTQGENIDNTLPSKKAECNAELLKLARQWNGFSGNSIRDFINSLDNSEYDDNWKTEFDRFVDSIQDPELKQYAEEYL